MGFELLVMRQLRRSPPQPCHSCIRNLTFVFGFFQEGNTTKSGGVLVWSEPPIALAQDSPYLIGLMKKSVEIRTDQPPLLIQTLEMADPKLVCCHKPGLTFVASSSQV